MSLNTQQDSANPDIQNGTEAGGLPQPAAINRRLTKQLFDQLPGGCYVVGKFFKLVISPAEFRDQQWIDLSVQAKHQLCDIYRDETHYKEVLTGSEAKELGKPVLPAASAKQRETIRPSQPSQKSDQQTTGDAGSPPTPRTTGNPACETIGEPRKHWKLEDGVWKFDPFDL